MSLSSAVLPSSSTSRAGENAVMFQNAAGQNLVGIWHEAHGETTNNDGAIVMLHGWSGYRTGPHQMLTRAARDFAGAGWNVLRFDFAGRGDSDGEAETSTLATMADDTRAAIEWCCREKGVSRIVLLGLCSGCEVAFACACEDRVTALALWSAPVFAAGQSDERRARKRLHHLKQYARKLLRPSTYAKLLSGRLDRASIQKAVAGRGGGESKNVETLAAGHLPPGWRERALRRFAHFSAPLLLVYGTSDPTTQEALAWHRARLGEKRRSQVREHFVAGANHSFYGLAWEREVFQETRRWLRDLKPKRSVI